MKLDSTIMKHKKISKCDNFQCAQKMNIKWYNSMPFIWFLSSIVPMTIFCLLSIILGEYYSHNGVIGFSEDYNLFNGLLIGTPAICIFYCILPRKMYKCLNQLYKNGAIDIEDNTTIDNYQTYQQKALSSLYNKNAIIIGFLVSTIFMTIAIPEHLKSKSWLMKHNISIISIELFWWVAFGIAIALMCRLLKAVLWVNKVFKDFKININPLYPDNVGGLLPLGRFSLFLSFLIFICGIQLGMNQYSTHYIRTNSLLGMEWTPDIVWPWLVYLIVSPIVFFAPFVTAHGAMKEAKEYELLLFSKKYEEVYTLLRRGLYENKNIDEYVQKVEEIRKLYGIVNSFPVWPYNFGTLFRFFSTTIIPLIATIIPNIFSVISFWKKP